MHTQHLIRSAAAAVAALHPNEAARIGAIYMLQNIAGMDEDPRPVYVAPCGYFAALLDGFRVVLQRYPRPRCKPHLPDGTPLEALKACHERAGRDPEHP